MYKSLHFPLLLSNMYVDFRWLLQKRSRQLTYVTRCFYTWVTPPSDLKNQNLSKNIPCYRKLRWIILQDDAFSAVLLHTSLQNMLWNFVSSDRWQQSDQDFYVQLDWTPSINTRRIKLPTNRKGYDKSETTVGKLSTRKIQICWVHFSVIILWPLNF